MADYVKVATIADVPSGSMKTVMAGNKKIAVANVDGEFFAVDDTCSHEQCSLGSEGFLDGSTITCGCHGAQFDASSGKVISLPATVDLKTYETKVEDGNVYVEL